MSHSHHPLPTTSSGHSISRQVHLCRSDSCCLFYDCLLCPISKVDISTVWESIPNPTVSLPCVTILHGQNRTPVQSLITSLLFTLSNNLRKAPFPKTKSQISNPTWDQFQHLQNAFVRAPTSHQHALCNHALSMTSDYNLSANGMDYNIDPNDTHLIADLLTNSIPQWHAYHPDHDSELLHFPAAVPNAYVVISSYFLSHNYGRIKIRLISWNIFHHSHQKLPHVICNHFIAR